MSIKPKVSFKKSGSIVRDWTISVTEHHCFESFIMVCIIANTVVLGFSWYMQSQGLIDIRDSINYAFMVIFTLEATVKVIA